MALPAPLQAYQRALQLKPIRTKAMVGCFTSFLSSLMAQYATSKGARPDLYLAFLFAIRGTIPFSHWWFGVLGGQYNDRLPVAILTILRPLQARLVTRVLVDQLFWRPILTAYTFVAMGLLCQHPWANTRKKFEDTFIQTYKNQLRVGIPQAFVNQGFIPIDWRTTFNDLYSLFWNAYLAVQCSKAPSSPTDRGGHCKSAAAGSSGSAQDARELINAKNA